jgi:tetratricopeptide (TPR) repeat protein
VGEPSDYERLVRFVASPGGQFGLALARYADPSVREGVMTPAILDAEAAGRKVAVLDLRNQASDANLLQRLRDSLSSAGTGSRPDAVFMINLDHLLLDPTGAPRLTPAIDELNRLRDTLPQVLPARAVLWLSDAAADALAHVARDLHDVVLTFFRFESREWPRAVTRHEELPGWMHLAQPDEESRLKREAALLERILDREATQPRAAADAAARLGQIYILVGKPAEGAAWLDRAREAFQKLGDHGSEALMLTRLGDLRRLHGDLGTARAMYEAALALYTQMGDVRSRAVTMGKIADILEARGQLDEALRIRREEELPVFERLGDVRSLVFARGMTARNLLARGRPGDRGEAAQLLRLAIADAERLQLPIAKQLRETMEKATIPAEPL